MNTRRNFNFTEADPIRLLRPVQIFTLSNTAKSHEWKLAAIDYRRSRRARETFSVDQNFMNVKHRA